MANQLKGFRLPGATLAQLQWLIQNGHGNQSAVVVKAIDRLYQEAAAQPPRPEAQEQEQEKGEN